jgi:hypothetical protein
MKRWTASGIVGGAIIAVVLITEQLRPVGAAVGIADMPPDVPRIGTKVQVEIDQSDSSGSHFGAIGILKALNADWIVVDKGGQLVWIARSHVTIVTEM